MVSFKKRISKKIKNHFDFKEDIEKELNLILFICIFAVLLAITGFASVMDSMDLEEATAFESKEFKITGFATKTDSSLDSKDNLKSYEVRMKYSPEFLVDIETKELDILKKEILVMREKVRQCVRGGEELSACVIKETKENGFDLNCNIKQDRDLKEIAKLFENCKLSETNSCSCEVDLSNSNTRDVYLINLKEIQSVAIYKYDSNLAKKAKKEDLSLEEKNEYIKNSIILRGFQVAKSEEEVYSLKVSGEKYFVSKNNDKFEIIDVELNTELIKPGVNSCELKESPIYDFCTIKEYEFSIDGEVKKVKPEFSVDFS